MKYIDRYIEKRLLEYVKQFPIVLLTGPRQSGKSTLLEHLFKSKDWEYITLDQRSVLDRIKSDPDLFVKDINSNIIIDEAQKIPDLFHSIKWIVDRGFKHRIILSGSANFQLMQQISESLAGRAGILQLYPFTLSEKYKRHNILEIILKAPHINTLFSSLKELKVLDNRTLFQNILWGGFPKLTEYRSHEMKINWFENYLTTYIERDLHYLTQVADPGNFQKFYQLLSNQCGNLLNLSNIANNIGVTVPTCRKYLQVLQTSYQYFLLNPFYLNIKKRLIKTPKIYNWDTGLLNYFLEHDTQKQILNSNKWGNILENFIISELMKLNSFLSKKRNIYFWRTSNGAEIDIVLENKNNLIPIEIKSGTRITLNNIRGLNEFINYNTGKKIPFGIVFYRGDQVFRFNKKILLIPVGYV